MASLEKDLARLVRKHKGKVQDVSASTIKEILLIVRVPDELLEVVTDKDYPPLNEEGDETDLINRNY